MTQLYEYTTTINKKSGVKPQDNMMEFDKVYQPYVVNKTFSYFLDTILLAQELNLRGSPMHDIPLLAHYEFLNHSVPKGSRFERWAKAEKSDEINLICAVYGYSPKQAREVVDLFSEDDIKQLKQKIYEGGTK